MLLDRLKASVGKEVFQRYVAGEIDASIAAEEAKKRMNFSNKPHPLELNKVPRNKNMISDMSYSDLGRDSPTSKSSLKSPEQQSFNRVKNFGKNVIKSRASFFNLYKIN